MASPELSRLDELFHAAADLPPAELDQFLDENCGTDAALREELLRLLRSDADASQAFMQPAAPSGADESCNGDFASATQIGRYTIVRRIGAGGMGVVYEARQDYPSRIVALKIVRPGMVSPAFLKRFTREAEILGRLQHPGIACIYEASVAEVQQPAGVGERRAQVQFFAMELVRGRPLSEYAADHKLTTRERLALFAGICDAVEHAHQTGVIHRDLKPANILVVPGPTEQGSGADRTAQAQPKILDFGVARFTDADIQAVTLHTEIGQFMGTIPYMSPEQVAGDSRLLDARSDVYALGVIIYELLAGRLPLDLGNHSIPEASRVINEEEPSRLGAIHSQLRGDIETIVAKALDKDKTQRYASAADFAADIRRYLREEPILARPASAVYRFTKFARRNKVLVVSSAVVLAVLVAGIIGTSVGMVRAREAERRAISDANLARSVSAFLNEDLIAAVELRAKGHDVGMREILDEAATRIEGRLSAQPAVEAEIRHSLGRAYTYLGAFDIAEKHLERAVELVRRGARMDADSHIKIMMTSADLRNDLGRPAEAEVLLNEALRESIRDNGETDSRTLLVMNSLARTYCGLERYKEAEALYQRVITIRRGLGDAQENQSELLTAMSNLGTVYRVSNRVDEANAVLAEVLDKAKTLLGTESTIAMKTTFDLGAARREQGRLDDAESLLAPLEKTMRRKMGEDHPHTLLVIGELSTLRQAQGRVDDALRLRIENVNGLLRVLGEDHPDTQSSIAHLVNAYEAMNQLEEAERWRAKLLRAPATSSHQGG